MDFTGKTQNIISLCTGMRGIERGLERAGVAIRELCYVEIEAFIIENLVKQMEQGVLDEAPVWSNLKTFDAQPFFGLVDGIIGGYPCQPFSVAGERKGTEDERHLFPYIERIIATTRPVWCFFENVGGHLTMGFPDVYASLRNLGYAFEAGIFTAEEVGAPHERERLFILAVRQELANCNSFGHLHREPEIKPTEGRFNAQHNTPASDNDELEYSNNNGHDGAKNRESNTEGKNGNATGQNKLIEPERSSNPGECENMANTTIHRLQEPGLSGIGELQTETGTGLHNIPKQSGVTMVNPNIIRCNDEQKECGQFGNDKFGQHEIEKQSGVNEQCGIVQSGNSVADTEQQGLQRFRRNTGEQGFTQPRNGSGDKWPAKPGQPQHEWEEPRVKSRLGFTVNGYNFREDLLRMAGNGVVEQTAEIAFRTLVKKFTSKQKITEAA